MTLSYCRFGMVAEEGVGKGRGWRQSDRQRGTPIKDATRESGLANIHIHLADHPAPLSPLVPSFIPSVSSPVPPFPALRPLLPSGSKLNFVYQPYSVKKSILRPRCSINTDTLIKYTCISIMVHAHTLRLLVRLDVMNQNLPRRFPTPPSFAARRHHEACCRINNCIICDINVHQVISPAH